MTSNEPDFDFKLLTLGESQVGKTCILLQYTENKFFTSSMSTIGIDSKIKYLTINDKQVKLKIWDTAGQERFRTITQQYYNRADGVLLVFALDNEESFLKTADWIKQINLHSEQKKIPIVLVGNKSDLPRKVSGEQAKELAEEYQLNYYETSALTRDNIDEAFECLANEIVKARGIKELIRNDLHRESATHFIINEEEIKKTNDKDQGCC